MNEREPLTTSDLASARPSDEPTASDSGHGSQGEPSPRSETAQEDRRDTGAGGATSPLFDQADRRGFQDRWNTIQTGFVDEPRKSVEQADALVAEAMSRLAETFAQERHALEAQWGEGADVSTEDLRVALQRYRSFFERLLAA